jgi:hypothetical protein
VTDSVSNESVLAFLKREWFPQSQAAIAKWFGCPPAAVEPALTDLTALGHVVSFVSSTLRDRPLVYTCPGNPNIPKP